MKVRPLLSKINAKTFIEDLLTAYNIEDVETYLNPKADLFESPWDYPNMDRAVDRLHKSILNKEQIAILQDPDGDGVMSAVIAYDFLKNQGLFPIVLFHTGKQHGITVSDEENIIEQTINCGATLLWVPDAGSGNIKECKKLKELGIDVLVTDHHSVERDSPYCILVNHHLGEGLNTQLTGSGVTEKVVWAYCEKYDLEQKDYSDLVGFSIASDVVDVSVLENRAIINQNLCNYKLMQMEED